MDIKEIERLLITTYRKDLYRPFIQAIAEYELIKPGDRIAVCISGGKDSLTMAKLMQEYQRHGQVPIEVVYIVMDPGFTEENVVALEENAKKMGIPIEIVKSDIFQVVERIAGDYPCYMCARMRRGTLYSIAKQKGCNKIALAHHFDDAIETILLNIFYGGTYKCMMPKLKAQNFPGMELIRPLIYIKEKDIIRFIKQIGVTPMNCGCVVAYGKTSSKRREVKNLIANMRKIYPNVDISIYRSAQNVNLNCALGWKHGDKQHSFLEYYDEDIYSDEN